MPTIPEIPEAMKQQIYDVVTIVPAGLVTTYGDIAAIVGNGCTAQIVGFALNSIPKDASATIPWQRVINAMGGISTRGLAQRHLLEGEGIPFDTRQRVDLRHYRWPGPDAAWLVAHGCEPLVLPPLPPDQLSLL
ncbi:MAG: hypothetical protein NVS4B8_07350 [Herpetosiphon sp.]